MKRYAIAIKNGCKLDIIIVKANSARELKILVFDMLVEKGMVSTTNIPDNKNIIAPIHKHTDKKGD